MNLTISFTAIVDISKPLLTVKEALNIIGYSYDQLYIDRFWNNIADDKWMYIGDEMLEWIGYATDRARQAKELYIHILDNNFQRNIDFRLLNASEMKNLFVMPSHDIELPAKYNQHNKVKHLIIAPDTFKESLMLVQTSKAKEIRKYYLEIEKIFKFYTQYQAKYHELSLQEEKSKNTNLMNIAMNYNQLQKKEYLYIATNARYAAQNNFKIGKTENLKQRLSAYNTSHNKKEPYYYTFVSEPTFDAKTIEYIIKHILYKFKNSETNELYVVNYEFLEKMVRKVCENYNESVDYYNSLIHCDLHKVSTIPKDIWAEEDDKDVEIKEKETIIHADQELVIEYWENNAEYPFICFRNNKFINYRCERCKYEFNRRDKLQAHFQRKIKCFDTSKEDRIAEIKANVDNPIIRSLDNNKCYNYYEIYDEEKKCIKYVCNHCSFDTIHFPSLKSHFKRKTKCFNLKDLLNEEVKVELLDDKEDNPRFYKRIDDGILYYHCDHCDYKSHEMANLRRHFHRPSPCWK